MIHTGVNIGDKKYEYPCQLDRVEFTIRDEEKWVMLIVFRRELQENKTAVEFLEMLKHKINDGIKLLNYTRCPQDGKGTYSKGLENDSKKHETDQE